MPTRSPTAPTAPIASDAIGALVRDDARLTALRASGLLEAAADAGLDRLVRMAARGLRAPMAFLAIVDEARDVFRAAHGLPAVVAEAGEVRGRTICHHTLAEATPEAPLVLADTHADPRHREAPLVRDHGARAYVGAPLYWGGQPVGALCVADLEPRTWTADEVALLQDLAAEAQQAVTLRGATHEAVREQQRVETVLSSISDAFFALDHRWRFTYVNDRAEQMLRRERAALLGRTFWDLFPEVLGTTYEREYRRAMATGESVTFDELFAPLGGWLEVRAHPSDAGLAVYFQDVTARRQATAALAESEARFRAVQDASPDGSVVLHARRDADGRIADLVFVYANAAASRLLFEHEEAFVGRSLREAFPDSVVTGRIDAYARVVETGVPWTGDIYYVRGGVDRGLRLTAVRVDDGVHVAFVDLSAQIRHTRERERLLAELQEQRGMLEAVNTQLPAGMIVAEAPSGRLIFSNQEAERILGHPMHPAESVADYHAYGVVHEDGRPYAAAEYPIARAVRGETLPPQLVRYRRGADGVIQLNVGAAPVFGVDGRVTHAVCTFVDVTVRELASERTRRLQQVTASLAAAVTATEVTDRFVAHAVSTLGAFGGSTALLTEDGAHARFAHAIGYPPEEVERWRTFPLAMRTPFGDAIRERRVVLLSSHAEWAARYPELSVARAPDRPPGLLALPLLIGDRVIGVLGLGFREADVPSADDLAYLETLAAVAAQALDRARAYEGEHAARAEAEHARQRAESAQREAETANAVKAQFLATMSHELRTPLNAIGGYAQLLEMGVHGPVNTAQLEALMRVQDSQRHLLGLINSVLNYAKLEAGTVSYDVQPLPALELVRAVEGLVAPQARAKGLALTVEDDAAGAIVLADPEKARQVLLNLLSNAIKFTPSGGSVTIGCARALASDGRASVALTVHDTGRGIATEQLARVFDPFVQVGRRLTAEDEGTGLGLAISRDLARGMGGELTVDSAEGAGATFVFTLPLADG